MVTLQIPGYFILIVLKYEQILILKNWGISGYFMFWD